MSAAERKPPARPAARRDYLLLSGLTRQQFAAAYPGRKLLFDFGTNKFPTSLAWFIEHYGAQGIKVSAAASPAPHNAADEAGRLLRHVVPRMGAERRVHCTPSLRALPPLALLQFDEIWAWEATPTKPEEYWASMPADVKHRLHVSPRRRRRSVLVLCPAVSTVEITHLPTDLPTIRTASPCSPTVPQWYNIPLDDQVKSPDHAVQFIKQLVKPGDFLVSAYG